MDISEIKKNIFKSSIVGVFRVLLAIPMYLILTPFVLNTIGVDDFAIWSFHTIAVNIILLGDFGFKNSLIYFLAKNINRTDKQIKYLSNSIFIFVSISVVLGVVVWLIVPYVVANLIGLSGLKYDKAVFVLYTITVSFLLRFLATPYQSILEGNQKLYYSQYIMTTWLISNFLFTIISLSIYPTIYCLAISNIFPNLIVFMLYRFHSMKDYPNLKCNFKTIEFMYIKEMLRYGSGIHTATIAILLREPLLKLLIVRYSDLAAVTIFEISYRLSTQAISIVNTPLLNSFSVGAVIAGDREKLNEVIPSFCNFNTAFLIPSFVFFFVFSEDLIYLWLGEGHGQTSKVVPLIFLSFCIYFATEPLYKTIEATGKSIYSGVLQLVSLVLMLSLFYIFRDLSFYTSSIVLLIVFGIFSVVNYIYFNYLFETVNTYNIKGVLILLTLSASYVYFWSDFTIEKNVINFFIYLLAHFILCDYLRIFDIVYLLKKVVHLLWKGSFRKI